VSRERVLCRLVGAIGVGAGVGHLLSLCTHPIAAALLSVALILYAEVAEWRLNRETSKQ
jgi:hypothetical protein